MFDKEPRSFEDYIYGNNGQRSWDMTRASIKLKSDRPRTEEEIDEILKDIQHKSYNDYVENFSYFEEIEPGKRWRLVRRNTK